MTCNIGSLWIEDEPQWKQPLIEDDLKNRQPAIRGMDVLKIKTLFDGNNLRFKTSSIEHKLWWKRKFDWR